MHSRLLHKHTAQVLQTPAIGEVAAVLHFPTWPVSAWTRQDDVCIALACAFTWRHWADVGQTSYRRVSRGCPMGIVLRMYVIWYLSHCGPCLDHYFMSTLFGPSLLGDACVPVLLYAFELSLLPAGMEDSYGMRACMLVCFMSLSCRHVLGTNYLSVSENQQ
jgi:hypothetical protein